MELIGKPRHQLSTYFFRHSQVSVYLDTDWLLGQDIQKEVLRIWDTEAETFLHQSIRTLYTWP